MGGEKLSEFSTDVLSNDESVRDGARKVAPDLDAKTQKLLDEDDEWQQRTERWKKAQQRREAVKKEKEESKEEEKDGGDRMDEDGGEEEDEAEPDESELMRKNKQWQWTLLRLLRRYDCRLFQKSDGKLDKVVDELKKRRQQVGGE